MLQATIKLLNVYILEVVVIGVLTHLISSGWNGKISEAALSCHETFHNLIFTTKETYHYCQHDSRSLVCYN